MTVRFARTIDVDAINKYPNYWKSLHPRTMEANDYAEDINIGIEKLKSIYPELKPAKIYFTIGALRTGGTTLADKVLIGTEIALADSTVITTELLEDYPHLVSYFKSNRPGKSIVFNNVHEYVHTQQDTTPTESVIFGKNNDDIIKNVFVKEMFTQFEAIWFWGNTNNQFKLGDLGYYIGYAICNSYYENANDKQQAIKNMIELDYLDENELYQFVDNSKYFVKTIAEYKKEIDLNRWLYPK